MVSGLYYLQSIKAVIPLTKGQWVYLTKNDAVVDQLWHVIDFSPAALTPEYIKFWSDLVEYLKNNHHNEGFYETLSWFGLKNTTAWNNLTTAEKAQINANLQNIYQNEEYCN